MAVPSSAVRSLRARSCASVTARKIGALPMGSITTKYMMKAVMKLSSMTQLYAQAASCVQRKGDMRVKTDGFEICDSRMRWMMSFGLDRPVDFHLYGGSRGIAMARLIRAE